MRDQRASVVLAALCFAGLLVVSVLFSSGRPHESVLIGMEPFDSNMPVQWDSSASVDLHGLSRYFSAAAAHLKHGAPQGHLALQARTMQLAQVQPRRRTSARVAFAQANRDLQKAQAGLRASLAPGRQQMLMGIGSWGSGEETDNAGDWEVAMHVDKGCEETLQLRDEGNVGWKRKEQNKCDPNKIQNPMMWPFDKPGEVWLHDSTDSGKETEKFPYDETALHDNVWDAEPTPAFADGIWHGEDYRRSYD